MDEKQALAELRFLEQELSTVIGQVVGRVANDDVRRGLTQLREDHAKQADDIACAIAGMQAQDMQPPDEFAHHVRALEREILHAKDPDGLFNGLADAERFDVGLHEQLLAEGLPAQVQSLVEQQTAEDKDHLDFLENRAPSITPAIHGVTSVPKRGRAVE